MILFSACLAGMNVRYDGGHCLNEQIRQLVEKGKAATICPEVIGGLSTPREPAEIVGGTGEDVLDGKAKVINKQGQDVTDEFINGAYATLKKAQQIKATLVVLKERSPSCGTTQIYDGNFSGKTMPGEGVTAALLKRYNIEVISDEQFIKGM